MDHQISSELPPVHTPEQATPSGSPFPEVAPQGEHNNELEAVRNIEAGVSGSPAPTAQQQTATTAGVSALQSGVTQNPVVIPASVPVIADDSDLIEKEWVVKAKEIVERTKHDPYQQNKEVERIKADYMKKRYNKDIKLTED